MPDQTSSHALKAAMQRVGRVVDNKYRLVGVIGVGGMGIVYEAEHQFLGRRVALKILHPRYVDKQQEFDRFLREARAVGAIGSRSIVEVFDAGFLDGTSPYLVMERLLGENLEQRIRRKTTLSAKRTFRIAFEALRGLAAAHAKKIVHCDMKPANVFLAHTARSRSAVKLLDFGISRFAVDGAASAIDESTGIVFGTPFYMAPEQVCGAPVDARTDIYAVGAIVYEALMGRPPFVAPSREELFQMLVRERPAPLRPPRGELPPVVSSLVMAMLEKKPSNRPESAAHVNKALIDAGAVQVEVWQHGNSDHPSTDPPAHDDSDLPSWGGSGDGRR